MHQRFIYLRARSITTAALTAIVFVLGVFAATPRLEAQQPEDKFQRTFAVNNGSTLSVENYKGTIHVMGTDTHQVVVNVVKRFEGSESDRKWWMENTQVNFRNDSSRVAIEVKYPSMNCMFCWGEHIYTSEVELEVQVPRQTNVDLNGYKPDIRISSVEGDIRIKSYKAPVTIDSTSGAIHIETYKDTLRLKNVAVRGGMEVHSFKADTDVEARSLEGSSTLESEKGSIILRFPSSVGLNVDYSGGRHASFHSDFPLSAQAGRWGGNVQGTINQGGPLLRLRTTKGSVSLEKAFF